MGRILRFPAGTDQNIVPPAVLHDNYGRHRYELPKAPDGTTPLIEPFAHEFGFEAQGLSIVPANCGHIERDTRGFLARNFGMNPELDPMQKLTWVGLEQDGAVVMGAHEDVMVAFPGAVISKLGKAWLVKKPKQTPIYSRTVRGDQETLVDHRSERLSQSLLKPDVRAILEECGDVVYESDPTNADRLLICIKHVHGSSDSPWTLRAMNPAAADAFMRHQSLITRAMGKMLVKVQNPDLFLETFPETTNGDDEVNAFASNIVRATAMPATLLTAKAKARGHFPAEFAFLTDNVRSSAVRYALTTRHADRVHGDGRFESENEFETEKNQLMQDHFDAKKQGGGVGVASYLHRQTEKTDALVFTRTHASLTNIVARHLTAGRTGIVPYGAMHFASGDNVCDAERIGLMEEYFAHLPKTQVVVVEPHNYAEVVHHFTQHHRLQTALQGKSKMEFALLEIELLKLLASVDDALLRGDDEHVRALVEPIGVLMADMNCLLSKRGGPLQRVPSLWKEMFPEHTDEAQAPNIVVEYPVDSIPTIPLAPGTPIEFNRHILDDLFGEAGKKE